MKYLRELIITVLLIGAGVLGWNYWQADKRLGIYEQRDLELQVKLDSVTALQHQADLHAIKMHTEYNQLKERLQAEAILTDVWRVKYEGIKNTPVPRLSDAGIDSALTRLYPGR